MKPIDAPALLQHLDGLLAQARGQPASEYRQGQIDALEAIRRHVLTAAFQVSEPVRRANEELVEMFLGMKRLEGYSRNTLDGYRIELNTFLRVCGKPIPEVTAPDIRMYLTAFGHLKPASLARKVHVLRSFFRTLADEDVIPKDPCRKVKPPKIGNLLPRALSPRELEMCREAAIQLRTRALFEFLLASGCRISEAVQLDRASIDWERQAARVIGKGNKERTVFFNAVASHWLQKYLATRTDDHPALFIVHKGQPRRMCVRVAQWIFRELGKAAGLKRPLTPHMLRHSFATGMVNRGAPLQAVQNWLGHTTPRVTQRYAVLSDAALAANYRQFAH